MTENRLPDYLGHIQQAIEDALSFVDSMSRESFQSDRKTQQAVVMQLLIIGEAATQVMDHYPAFVSANSHVPWREMRTMRNRIAHGYFSIDLDIVWNTVHADLPDLLETIQDLESNSGP